MQLLYRLLTLSLACDLYVDLSKRNFNQCNTMAQLSNKRYPQKGQQWSELQRESDISSWLWSRWALIYPGGNRYSPSVRGVASAETNGCSLSHCCQLRIYVERSTIQKQSYRQQPSPS